MKYNDKNLAVSEIAGSETMAYSFDVVRFNKKGTAATNGKTMIFCDVPEGIDNRSDKEAFVYTDDINTVKWNGCPVQSYIGRWETNGTPAFVTMRNTATNAI